MRKDGLASFLTLDGAVEFNLCRLCCCVYLFVFDDKKLVTSTHYVIGNCILSVILFVKQFAT